MVLILRRGLERPQLLAVCRSLIYTVSNSLHGYIVDITDLATLLLGLQWSDLGGIMDLKTYRVALPENVAKAIACHSGLTISAALRSTAQALVDENGWEPGDSDSTAERRKALTQSVRAAIALLQATGEPFSKRQVIRVAKASQNLLFRAWAAELAKEVSEAVDSSLSGYPWAIALKGELERRLGLGVAFTQAEIIEAAGVPPEVQKIPGLRSLLVEIGRASRDSQRWLPPRPDKRGRPQRPTPLILWE
jgi:hypothetical protein